MTSRNTHRIDSMFSIDGEEGEIICVALILGDGGLLKISKSFAKELMEEFGFSQNGREEAKQEVTSLILRENVSLQKKEEAEKESLSPAEAWIAANAAKKGAGGTSWDNAEKETLVQYVITAKREGRFKQRQRRKIWMELSDGILDRTPEAVSTSYHAMLRKGEFKRISDKLERAEIRLKAKENLNG